MCLCVCGGGGFVRDAAVMRGNEVRARLSWLRGFEFQLKE